MTRFRDRRGLHELKVGPEQEETCTLLRSVPTTSGRELKEYSAKIRDLADDQKSYRDGAFLRVFSGLSSSSMLLQATCLLEHLMMSSCPPCTIGKASVATRSQISIQVGSHLASNLDLH